jgi:hypothetical protein
MKTKNYSNKMLFIILAILILLCISYLYLKNKNEDKEIEGFTDYKLVPQSTQQSLSIYSVNPIDSNTRGIVYDNTQFNSTGIPQDSRAYGWNGYWTTSDNKYYMSILQLNDILILSINIINVSNTSPYNNITEEDNIFTATDSNGNTFNSSMNCPLNNFTAQCQLNFNRTKFYIKNPNNIYCNNLVLFNNVMPYFNYILSGYIDGNNITISYFNYYTLKMANIIFNKDTTTNNSYNNASATYSLTESKLINPYPQLPPSTPTYNSSTTSYNNKNTFMPINILSQYNTNNNSYKLCSLINNINNNNRINAYIFYISDFINVQTLDYSFWGIGQNDSNLTLKNTNLAYVFALKIQNYINSKNFSIYNLQQFSSYTYCGNSNNKDLSFTQEGNDFNNNFNNIRNNNSLNKKTPVVPIMWNISSSYKSSTCYISLSSVADKNNTVKYPVFNSDGSINMSINNDGTNQELILEDINTIKNDSNYFISTGNFRTNDLLYMVSNNTNTTLQGDNTVKLVSKPKANGRWVIIGFNNNANINNIINSSF